MFRIGCHLSSAGGYLAMGQTAVSIGANVFQFFTRNPRGGASKPIDPDDVRAFRAFAAAMDVGPLLAHAPYTLNAAGADSRVRAFAEAVMTDDLKRLERTPGALYNFHPGSHVGQGVPAGIALVSDMLVRILSAWPAPGPGTTILLETMAGKGSEIGGNFGELREIVAATEDRVPGVRLGVCLDTCHVWDAGFDVADGLSGVLDEFDAVLGLDRLRAIHLNDSLNARGARKDRHAGIGKGKIGLDAFARIINEPRLADRPFYLETPCDLDGYRAEIALLKTLRSEP